jgi:hypothetical protein
MHDSNDDSECTVDCDFKSMGPRASATDTCRPRSDGAHQSVSHDALRPLWEYVLTFNSTQSKSVIPPPLTSSGMPRLGLFDPPRGMIPLITPIAIEPGSPSIGRPNQLRDREQSEQTMPSAFAFPQVSALASSSGATAGQKKRSFPPSAHKALRAKREKDALKRGYVLPPRGASAKERRAARKAAKPILPSTTPQSDPGSSLIGMFGDSHNNENRIEDSMQTPSIPPVAGQSDSGISCPGNFDRPKTKETQIQDLKMARSTARSKDNNVPASCPDSQFNSIFEQNVS